MTKSVTKLLLLYATALPVACPAQGLSAEKNILYYIQHAPFPMQEPERPSIPDRSYLLSDFGAVGDGQALNTEAFGKAIAACAAAGGGRIVVPAGAWLTGPIRLRSNIDLHLERGAMILFSRDHAPYRAGIDEGQPALLPPISGHDLENVSITGEGIFDGGGDSWRPVKKEKSTAAQWKNLLASGGALNKEQTIWWPSREAMEGKENRPVLLQLNHCRRILLEGITLRNSPKFVFYPNNCTDLTMDHVTIFNEWWAQNGDGIDISACRNVMVYHCTVSAGDDGICMKSGGTARDGQAALQNVIIAGCTVYHGHGGFVIGSNTDGGIHRIFVSDCNFIGTDIGLRFKSNMGRGGLVDSIFIQDIFMQDIVNEAVLFDTYYEDMPAGAVKDPNKARPAGKTPEFRDFHISRIYCNGARTAISITGLPQMPVHKIWFDTITISAGKGLVATQAREIDLHQVRLITREEPVFRPDSTAHLIIR
jgi:polygalacturonase